MPTLSNKHANAQRVFYPGFNGGLNLSVPNESVPKNELKEALNVEFSSLTGSMKVRGGLVWSGHFDREIIDVVPVLGRQGFLARQLNANIYYNKLYFFKWNTTWPVQNSLSGVGGDGNTPIIPMSIVPWVDADDKECWLIAAGGGLNKFIDSPIPKIEAVLAPGNIKFIFIRDNRVGIVVGDDVIKFSAVGDCESWTNDPKDESSAQWIQIGYKDGMKVDAVMPLSKDWIIFKSPEGEPDKGTIYRLTGEFPEWQVVEVAHNIGTFSQQSVCVAGNDVFFATVGGLATLSNVTSYGEVKANWPDRKVSTALAQEIDSSAKVYDVPVKQQIWLSPNKDSKQLWVLDYTRGIWTKFEFPERIIYAAGVDNSLFVFIGKDVYEVNDWYTHDDTSGGTSKRNITAKMKLGTILSGRQTLIKGVFASFGLFPLCRANIKLGDFVMDFTIAGSVDYIYSDTDIAYNDDDPLVPMQGVLTSRRRCIIRDWALTPEVTITGGGCSLSTIGLETVEV